MKNFVRIFILFAIFMIPANLCAAKNYVPVYPADWNNFIDNFKIICNKVGVNFAGVDNVKDGSCTAYCGKKGDIAISAASSDLNDHLDAIIFDADTVKMDSNEAGATLAAILYAIGLNDDEVQETGRKIVECASKIKPNATSFKKNLSVKCSARGIKISLDLYIGSKFMVTIKAYE